MRYAVAVALLAVIALVFGLYGSDSLLFLGFFGWPVAVGSLLSSLTRMRLSRAMFISACVGVVPGGLLALGNLFFGHHSPSAD
ncbi:MAG: hypothetical protein M3P29_06265, partial [Acidobacteriota bacterium]|nr:hypothetical protein [Acidobacteriota bacterium]